MVQAVSMGSYKDPTTLKGWEGHFHNVMAHLGHIKNAFEAVMYIIYTVFPTVENFNSWRMENKAQAMEAVSQALQELNTIKAEFNECQTPGYWSKNMKGTKLETEINAILWRLHHNPALKGIAKSIVTQLKVMTHASQYPQLWHNIGSEQDPKWIFGDTNMKWFDGSKEVTGSSSTFLKWMWSQEWQGRSVIPSKPTNWYRITMWKKANGQLVVTVYHMFNGTFTQKPMSIADFEKYVKTTIGSGKSFFTLNNGRQNPVFLKDGNVNYWDGNAWVKDVPKQQYIDFIDKKVIDAKNFVEKNPGGPHDYTNIDISQLPPPPPGQDPKYTTGPTSQAFDAISTTFNSQSSEDQSKFKYLQSNMEQYLGIENSTMTQIIKQEQNITGFTKQQSS